VLIIVRMPARSLAYLSLRCCLLVFAISFHGLFASGESEGFVDVVVMKGSMTDGEILANLDGSDFTITENGIRCNVVKVSRMVPADVVFLLDRSSSMDDWWATKDVETGVMSEIRRLSGLLPEESRCSVLAFDQSVYPVAIESRQLPPVPRASRGPGRPTALYEALGEALIPLGASPGRRIIVVVTDGEDNSSELSLSAIGKEIDRSLVTVHIAFATSDLPAVGPDTRFRFPPRVVAELPRRSGGTVFPFSVVSFARIEKNFHVLSNFLRGQYRVFFRRSSSVSGTKKRTVQVRVSRERWGKVRLFARRDFGTQP